MFPYLIQYIGYLIILIILAIPLGKYIGKVMNNEKTFLTPIFSFLEKPIYKILKINQNEQMNYKTYTLSIIIFSILGFLVLFFLQIFQGFLFGNPEQLPNVSWDLALNTAVSFVTNTNWQSYYGESTLSYLTQFLGLAVQNFVSASVGIAVLFALIRGFNNINKETIGNFWVDMTRILIRLLIPINLIISFLLVSGGVIQSLKPYEQVQLLEPIAITQDGNIIKDANIDLEQNKVFIDGKEVEDAKIIKEQVVPLGPVASQVAIKQSGTNGGGFFGVNSAHPLENPNAFTNLIEMISILLIPAALCFTFGRNIKNKKQGIAIFMAMFLCLIASLFIIAF